LTRFLIFANIKIYRNGRNLNLKGGYLKMFLKLLKGRMFATGIGLLIFGFVIILSAMGFRLYGAELSLTMWLTICFAFIVIVMGTILTLIDK